MSKISLWTYYSYIHSVLFVMAKKVSEQYAIILNTTTQCFIPHIFALIVYIIYVMGKTKLKLIHG